jgi:hypothetical protein
MGPLDKNMLFENALSATGDGFDLIIRSHWYRSLPLSCIGNISLAIDDEMISPGEIGFELNGNSHSLAELPALYQDWWFILDPAVLHIKRKGLVKKGETHRVAFELGLLIPYVLVGPEAQPMLSAGKITKILKVN